MRKVLFIFFSISLFTSLACGLAVQGQTSSPMPPPAASASGGLGFSIAAIKKALQINNLLAFTNSTTGEPGYLGQPLITSATLSGQSITKMKIQAALASGFSATFYGSPANISAIEMAMPYSKAYVIEDGELLSAIPQIILGANSVKADQITAYHDWLTSVFSPNLAGSQTTTIGAITYALIVDGNTLTLVMVPAQ